MKNIEKYREELLDAIRDERTWEFYCEYVQPECYIPTNKSTCAALAALSPWLEDEYKEPKEPEVNWSKVPVDTPILVRQSDNDVWHRRYFAKYEDKKVWTWRSGSTSWSAYGLAPIGWLQAKLAEDEDGSNE